MQQPLFRVSVLCQRENDDVCLWDFQWKVFGGSQCRAEQRVLVGVVYRASSLSTHDSAKFFELERISLSPLRASE